MLLLIRGPMGHCEELSVSSMGMSLGYLLPYKFELVLINGRPVENWQDYIPVQGDRVEVTSSGGDFLITPAAVGTTFGISGTGFAAGAIAAVANAVIMAVISTALSSIIRAVTPKPKKPEQIARAEAFGIAGFNNTTGPGVPKFTPYGLNKVRGHVIASGANLSPDGTQMYGRVLYFMGWMGDDGCQSIDQIELNGSSIDQFEEVQVHTRLGVNPQPVITEFENVDNIFTPPVQSLNFNPSTGVGTPVIYTTHSSTVQRATLFLNFPGGLYRINNAGRTRQATVMYRIEFKPNAGSTWTVLPDFGITDMKTSGNFKTYQIDFPSAGKWDIRVTVTAWPQFFIGGTFIGDSMLFNVQETQFTTLSYPGWALLGLTDIPSRKVRSFEGMDVSAVVEGKRVKIPDGLGNFTLAYTRKRCWIVRDMLTHPIVGMGYEFDESEVDDQQWLADAQAYYDEPVLGHDGMEPRDLCDFVLGDLDWDWEWIKKVAGEARGRLIPSGSKWKYVIDKPGTPNLLYAEGGNIVEDSVFQEISKPDRPFTHVTAQFRNAEKDYEPDYAPAIFDPEAVSAVQNTLQYDTITRESETLRENMIVFKRNFLERRRWSFTSPMTAIVSEPMDLDYFAERSLGGEGSYGGFLPPGSTASSVLLPEIVTLKTGGTYALIVKHHQDNTTEYRQVSTAAGTWGAVSVATAFTQAPAEGDIFSLGMEVIDHIVTRAQELEIDREGRVRQVRTEYIPAVYTPDPLPPKSSRRFFGPMLNRAPIPLRDAVVHEEVAMNRDGSVRSILMFDVTPGLSYQAGIAQGGAIDRVVLAADEPGQHSYFNGAQITINNETQTIVSYFGITEGPIPAKTAFPTVPFQAVPTAGTGYVIQWERFGEFGGFRVEESDDNGVSYFTLGSTAGTHWESDGRGAGPGEVWFRFTPVSIEGVENAVARPVVAIVIQGDLSAPAQPISVTVSSYLLTVRVLVQLQKPVAEDFNGVEIELYRNAISGSPFEVTRFGAPSDSGTGTMQVEATFNLGARQPPEPYGTVVWARACSVDFSQNKSAFVNSPTSTTLTPDPGVSGIGIGPPAIPTGLALATGTQIDQVDGTVKVFLDISWTANTEIDMSRYEVQYRQQTTPPSPYTVRLITHPQISTREFGVTAQRVYEARIQAIDTANNLSGFSSTVSLLTAKDTTLPAPPTITSLIPGFRQINLFFTPPVNTPDFECAQVYISTTNSNPAPAGFWGESASQSIQFIINALNDDTEYFVWLRSRDSSGNVGPFNTGPTAGTHNGPTRRIGPGDIVTTNLLTNFAQIGVAVMDQAYASTLTADKIIGGTLQVAIRIGVGNQIFLNGDDGNFVVLDNNNVARVVLGKLGPAATDFGLNIFGANGSIWHSFTGGTQTAGIALNAVNNLWEAIDDSEVTISDGHGALPTVLSLVVNSEGSLCNVRARIKVSPPITGGASGFNMWLYRDGIPIDFEWETTSNGKHFHLTRFDVPGAGVHTYSIRVDNRESGGWSFLTGAKRIEVAEIKR